MGETRQEDRDGYMMARSDGPFRMSEELVQLLRQRVAERYYDNPQVIDIIARAILHSRGIYPS